MPRPITPADLWKLPRVGPPIPIPGPHRRIAVAVTTYEVGANVGNGRLWLIEADGMTRALTPPELNATKPAPSPDGEFLAFLASTEDKKEKQLFVISLRGVEADPVPLTTLPLGVLGARWMPEAGGQRSSSLIVLAYLLKEHLSIEATEAELGRRKDAKFTVHVTEDATYRYWDTWLTTGEVPHLFSLGVDPTADSGPGPIRDLTPGSTRWWTWPNTDDPYDNFDISPDGRHVAYSADASEPPHQMLRHSIFELEIATGAERELTPDAPSHAVRPRYSPDGLEIAYGQQHVPGFYGDRVRLSIYHRATDQHQSLTEEWDRSAEQWTFDGHGHLLFVAEDLGRSSLFRLGPGGGQPEKLALGGTLASPAVASDGTVYLSLHGLSQPPEAVRLGSRGELHPVSRFTYEALTEIQWGGVEERVITGADSEEIQMFIISPPGAGTERLPLVHLIHGGPHGAFADAWQWRWHAQAFTANGYRVAMVNFHGSTGFGPGFTSSIQGAWGDLPYRDIEAATDHLIGAGLVTEERMAVAGGSYGGFLAAFITAQNSRYACAVVHAGVTNFGGMYASDITSGRALAYGAETFEDRARVDRYSPSSHAAGYATPTLVVHGEHDFRVPVTQSLELYGVLKAKGVPARLVHYPGENHWILSPQASLHWYQEVFSWLNLYLN